MARVTLVRDTSEMSAAAAGRITSLIEGAIVIRHRAAIALAGGDTPSQLYACLADPDRPWRARIDWTRVDLFWGDERHVPPDDPDSNFGLARRTLIAHVPVPAPHVHRIRGELQAIDAAREYDALLRARQDDRPGPLFDVVLLGIGRDAHIASLFPDSPLLGCGGSLYGLADHCGADPAGPRCEPAGPTPAVRELAAAIWVRQLNRWRVTLMPPAILDAAAILVLAVGSAKAGAVAAAIEGDLDVARYPAQLLREAGDRVEWIVDGEAAARLISL